MTEASRSQSTLAIIKDLRQAFKRSRKKRARQRVYEAAYEKFKPYTMISKEFYTANLALANTHVREFDLYDGSVIECGTWSGGMSFGLVSTLAQVQEFHCFDSFQGLPKVGPLDGDVARRLQDEGKLFATNNITTLDNFNAGLQLLDPARASTVEVHAGWFSESMAGFRPTRPISVLRIDCDWYDSVMLVLDVLFDQVRSNGLIIIDDYMAWEGCSRAVHDFLSKRMAPERIQLTGPRGVFYIIKDYPNPLDLLRGRSLEDRD